jgi:asparagine synthase (glutamine-hydrolysing)
MPGLVGAIHIDRCHPLDVDVCQKMSMTIRHRDWYRTDTYIDDDRKIAISRVHLSIVNARQQPYICKDGRLKIFLHGEIFNDDADDSHQIEVIHQLYERFGVEFARYLNGSFVVIIIDEARDIVVIANDRTASRPLFYFSDGQTFYFAPELKALLPIPSLRKKLNPAAMASFLAAGYFLNGMTLIEDVQTLDNATILCITDLGIRGHKYWDYAFDEGGYDRGLPYYQSTLAELIRQAINRRIRSHHRYGILLSGGYDSRGILGCYLEAQRDQPVHTISWGCADDIPHSDCAIAQRLAVRLGTRHSFYRLRPESLPQHLRDFIYLHDGLTDACGNYPEALDIFRQIREQLGVQILLRGDECFGWVSTAFDEKSMFQTLGIDILDRLDDYRMIFTDHYRLSFSETFKEFLKDISSRCQEEEIHNRKDFFYLDQRLKYYLNYLNYVKTIEIEVRTPYIDNDILDFVCTLPVKYRTDKFLYRYTIKNMFKNIFDEMASRSDEIDWHFEIKRSHRIRQFFYEELIGSSIILSDILTPQGMEKLFLDLNRSSSGNWLKTIAVQFLGNYPEAYNALKQRYKLLYKKMTPDKPVTSTVTRLFRLLTLKTWGSLFLP